MQDIEISLQDLLMAPWYTATSEESDTDSATATLVASDDSMDDVGDANSEKRTISEIDLDLKFKIPIPKVVPTRQS